MPEEVTYEERYWTVCWKWIFPYPCRKTRTVTRWCYDFSWVREQRFLFACRVEGCEYGRLYRWWAFCFGLVGTEHYGRMRLCFKSKRAQVGTCATGAVEAVRSTLKRATNRVSRLL